MSFELKLEQVSLNLQRPDCEDQLLFKPFSTTIHAGDQIVVTGASGQGKSSLLKILARLVLPTTGTLYWNGHTSSHIEVTKWRTMIHYVAQQAIMLPGTIRDNLCLASRLHQLPFDEQTAAMYMKAVGLEHLDWTTDASTLSGGEKQRIALIRSLLLEPTILLLDEITASLDQHHMLLVEKLLEQWVQKKDRAFVWVTHNPEQVERLNSSRWSVTQHEYVVS